MVVKFSTIFNEDSIKKLKHLAVDADESLGILLEEAIQDILKKNERRLKK
jgi:predicted transcriptional regulator